MYALIENGKITRINIELPTTIGRTSIPKGAIGLKAFDLYPIVGDEPEYNPERQRIAGPQYVFDGTQVNRVFTVEQIPDAEKAGQVRSERDQELAKTDWSQGKDIADAVSAKYTTYRQALRDVPTQSGFPWTVQWPTKPE